MTSEEEELRQCARYGEYEEVEALLSQVGNTHLIVRSRCINVGRAREMCVHKDPGSILTGLVLLMSLILLVVLFFLLLLSLSVRGGGGGGLGLVPVIHRGVLLFYFLFLSHTCYWY